MVRLILCGFQQKENRPKRGGCDISDFSTSSFYFIKPEKNTDKCDGTECVSLRAGCGAHRSSDA